MNQFLMWLFCRLVIKLIFAEVENNLLNVKNKD